MAKPRPNQKKLAQVIAQADKRAKTILPEPKQYFEPAEFKQAVTKEAAKGPKLPTKTREQLQPQWTGHYNAPKGETKLVAPPKPSMRLPEDWKPQPIKTSDAGQLQGLPKEARINLVQRLLLAYRRGRLKVVDMAKASGCASSSVGVWLRGAREGNYKSLPTPAKIPALEQLLKSVGE